MTVLKSVVLFVLAALLEIGGAWLVWQGVREHRGWLWAGAGVLALGAYGFVAAFQPTRTSGACWPRTAASSSQARCCGAWSPTASGPTAGTSRARPSASSESV